MNKLAASIVSALVLGAPLLAQAQSDYVETTSSGSRTADLFDNRWYITPFGSYTFADGDRNAGDGWGGGLAVGKPVNEWMNLELRAMYSQLNGDGNSDIYFGKDAITVDGGNITVDERKIRYNDVGDFEILDIGIDAQWFFRRHGFQPFLLAGFGATYSDFSCDSGTRRIRGPGIPSGTKVYLPTCSSEGSGWNFMANAGAGFLVPITDNLLFRMDGRYRWDSNEGNLGGGNSDYGDWIVSAGIQIPLGRRAAAPVTRTYSLSADALFDFDESTLRPEGRASVVKLSRDLDEVTYDSVDVTGHTDPLGSDMYNQGLSERRAMTVSDELSDNGVPPDRISARGMGETDLKVTPEECAAAGARSKAALIECYQPNRRVDVSVYGVQPK
jgi:OOP family OmpA-OmpF porin